MTNATRADPLAGDPAQRARERIIGWVCKAMAYQHPKFDFAFVDGFWTATPKQGGGETFRERRADGLSVRLRG